MAERRYALIGQVARDLAAAWADDITVTGNWTFTGDTVFQDQFTILDSTGNDSAVFDHDGTDLNTTFTNTPDWNINGLSGALKLSGNLNVAAGGILRVIDSSGSDSVAMSHDGTDFNSAFTNTTDWNVTGLTAISFDNNVRIESGNLFNMNCDGSSYISIGQAGGNDICRIGGNGANGLADDATLLVPLGANQNDGFIMAFTTAGNQEYAFFYSGNGTVHSIAAGTSTSVGSTNPDVDGNFNVYMSGSDVGIKNRSGSNRNVRVFAFGT